MWLITKKMCNYLLGFLWYEQNIKLNTTMISKL